MMETNSLRKLLVSLKIKNLQIKTELPTFLWLNNIISIKCKKNNTSAF